MTTTPSATARTAGRPAAPRRRRVWPRARGEVAETVGHLLAAPVEQRAEQQHQTAVDQQLADVRRLTDKPAGGGANIGTNLGHNRRAAHIQQTVPGGYSLSPTSGAVEPGEIRQRHISAADEFDQRNAVIHRSC
ncbi:hypothetical protein J4733_17705 [Klebsiella pneumoniae]|uniref:Uncharacterized protein n=1 Tax=Klebsiella pneumoniae TaxID=573 RepID=A0A939SRY0_KLEPN|nr:hypothetical protein [Klebsiella pneumoniae]